MAILASPATVSTSVTRLDVPETVTRLGLTVVNRGTASVFLGGAGVTASAGFELAAGERLSMMLRPSDGGLYAVAASGSHRVDRLQVGWS